MSINLCFFLPTKTYVTESQSKGAIEDATLLLPVKLNLIPSTFQRQARQPAASEVKTPAKVKVSITQTSWDVGFNLFVHIAFGRMLRRELWGF